MVWHHVPFYNFYLLVPAQCPNNILQVFSVLIVYYFSSVFRYNYDVVLAQPFRMC